MAEGMRTPCGPTMNNFLGICYSLAWLQQSNRKMHESRLQERAYVMPLHSHSCAVSLQYYAYRSLMQRLRACARPTDEDYIKAYATRSLGCSNPNDRMHVIWHVDGNAAPVGYSQRYVQRASSKRCVNEQLPTACRQGWRCCLSLADE